MQKAIPANPNNKKEETKPIPFDEALRRMLSTPPKHEPKKAQKKTGK